MFLASTNDIIRIVTGSGVSSISVQASWVDYASGTATPGRTNTVISTATTTTVVASPASSTYRSVRTLLVQNSSTSDCVVTVQHYDGTTSIDIEKITLHTLESFVMAEDGEWQHLTAFGAEYEYSGTLKPHLGISGTLAETVPRHIITETDLAAPPASGTLFLCGINLPAGTLVSNISFFSAGTAAGVPTNWFFALYGLKNQLLAQSANQTTTAWAANTLKTLAMTTPYTIPRSNLYYLGIMVTATTIPTLKGATLRSSSNLAGLTYNVTGASTTGLTTALPDPCIIPSGSATLVPWAAVS